MGEQGAGESNGGIGTAVIEQPKELPSTLNFSALQNGWATDRQEKTT